jgi:hypothetical protein
MTAIIGAPAGTYVTLRTYRKLSTNPSLLFANTYEFEAQEPISEGSANFLISRWTSFELLMSLTDVQADRAILSTWIEDGEPYDPTSFITVPTVGVGDRLAGGQALSLNNVLFLRRQTSFGQNGKLFLRRVLTEEDVLAPSGTLALANQAALQAEVDDALSTSGAGDYLIPGEAFLMVMKSALLIQRPVTALIVAGARVMQYNNRYFDVP